MKIKTKCELRKRAWRLLPGGKEAWWVDSDSFVVDEISITAEDGEDVIRYFGERTYLGIEKNIFPSPEAAEAEVKRRNHEN